jgi:hypothetical protein
MKKDPSSQVQMKQFVNSEFKKGMLLEKKQFEAIDFLLRKGLKLSTYLRKGKRKLEMLESPHLQSIEMPGSKKE